MNISTRLFAGIGVALALLSTTPATAQVSLSTGSHDFSTQPIADGPTGAFTFTLSNAGASTANVSLITINGADSTEFAIDSSGCGTTLAAASSCNVGVTFDPSTVGAKSAQLEVTSDAGNPTATLAGAGIDVPDKPLNVTGVGGIGQVVVSFDPPATDNGSAIGSYLVTSTPDGITANGTGSPITVTGLANATSYTFVVAAVNGVGQGPDSDPSASVSTQAVAPGGAMRVLARARDSLALVDVVDIDDGGSAITGYQVTSNPDGIIASGATLPIVVSGLTNGLTYTFTATVTNAIGTTPVAAPSHTIRPFAPSAPTSPLVYVPSLFDGDVYVIDTRDNTVITRVVVGSSPTGVAASQVGNRVYVANADDDTVSVIDTMTMQVIATVPVGTGPSGVAVNPAGTKVYVSNSGSDSVSVIETTGNSVATTIAGVTAPRGLVVSPDGTRVYVASGLKLRAIDTATDTFAAINSASAGFGLPAGVDITPDGSQIFASNVTNFKVNRFPNTLLSTATTDTAPGISHGIAVHPNGTVYVARTSGDSLAIFNGATPNLSSAVITTIPVGDKPRGVAITPNGQFVYVANENSDDVYVVRTSDNTVVATIPAGFGPGALSRFIGPAAPPREPQTVTAVRGNAQATVSFGAPGYDGGLPVTSYTVTSSPGSITATGSGSPIVVNGLTNGTPYTFTVTASNAKGAGPASAPSNSVTPATLPSAPQNLSALGPDGEADISFSAPASTGGSPITGYTLTCLPGPITISAGTALVIAATGLTNGQQYTCTVAAMNAVGTGPASAPVTVTPNAANYAVTVTRSGAGSGSVTSAPGGIACAPTCSAPFATSSSVALTATPAAGSSFAGWSGACTGTGACNLTIDAAKSVTATFTLVPSFVLNVTNQGTGSGTVTSAPPGITCGATCSAAFQQATVVALTPSAAAGSSFTGWGGACTGTGACNVTMDAAKSVTATFDLDNPPRLVNISTRGQVLTGNDRMIAGFIIGGSSNKTVVINVAGPSLNQYGLNGLADPTLTLVRSADQSVVATNDNWQSQLTPVASNALQATGFQPNDPKEPAIIATLPPGAYTAIVEGVDGGTGTGLVGVFEVDHIDTPLINISTRGQVLTGNDVMIAGFIVGGSGPQKVVINVAGPSLNPYGLAGLANPTLTLVRSSDQFVIAANDDWQTQANPADVAAIQATGFQPNNAAEAAIIATLPPGAYTVIVSGAGNTTGVGLVGVFTAP